MCWLWCRSATVRLIDGQQNMVKWKCFVFSFELISSKTELTLSLFCSVDWYSFQGGSCSKSWRSWAWSGLCFFVTSTILEKHFPLWCCFSEYFQVILSPDADPPVVRMMDYRWESTTLGCLCGLCLVMIIFLLFHSISKYRYEQQKRKKEQQKKSTDHSSLCLSNILWCLFNGL